MPINELGEGDGISPATRANNSTSPSSDTSAEVSIAGQSHRLMSGLRRGNPMSGIEANQRLPLVIQQVIIYR